MIHAQIGREGWRVSGGGGGGVRGAAELARSWGSVRCRGLALLVSGDMQENENVKN